MKKYFYLFMCAVMSCTATTFTSCSNEEEVITFPIEEELAGSYKGQLKVNVDGQDLATQSQKITVEKAGETSINLSLKKFSFMGINIGDVELADCPLTKEGETYSFTGTTTLDVAPLKADVQATGTIGAGKVEVNMDIAADLGGTKQSVKVVYTGDKLKGTESSEAKITKFIFDRNVAEVDSLVIVQPTIDEENKTITFMVADTAKAEYLKALVPTIEVSEKATVTPGSEVAQDFSEGKVVKYTVEAEDGTTVVYNAYVSSKALLYDFETWVPGVEGQEPENTFYEPQGWSSSNTGAHFLKQDWMGGLADSYVVMPTDDSHSGGSAALVKTIDTKGKKGGVFMPSIPKVTTGSMFLGTFITDMSNTLNSTKFGIPYAYKPVSLKGWYKYTPGKEYYIVNEKPYDKNCYNAVLDETKRDEFMISIVLYETEKYDLNNWSDCLTGVYDTEKNIYTSNRIAAIKQLTGGEAKEWTSFELKLEAGDWKKEYDSEKLYRLAVICSSSKDGDKFWGAPESTLIVDDLSVEVE